MACSFFSFPMTPESDLIFELFPLLSTDVKSRVRTQDTAGSNPRNTQLTS